MRTKTVCLFLAIGWSGLVRLDAASLPREAPLTPSLPPSPAAVHRSDLAGAAPLEGPRVIDLATLPTQSLNTVVVASYDAALETADQPGTTADLDAGDARVLNAVYSQRRVFFTLTDDVFANGAESGFYVGRVNVDTLASEGSGTYWSTATHYFYPAITLAGGASADADLGLIMSYSDGATTFASSAFKVFENFPQDFSGAFLQTGAGLGPYEARDGIGRNRWGDYLGVAWDWTCGTFWAAGRYAGVANSWRTRLTQHAGPLGDACQLIFDDGFESGSTGRW